MAEESYEEVKKITAQEEYKLEVNGFVCPDAYVNSFTPLEFEEVCDSFVVAQSLNISLKLVQNFQEFDSNKSGTIDIYEIRKILHHMDMDMSKENSQELMDLLDADGSGEIDFNEFCS
jgi:Ca2+-binding EF-hand superfamily protein